jgi:hypothetical protein
MSALVGGDPPKTFLDFGKKSIDHEKHWVMG